MAEINGEFPRYTEPNKKSGQKKGKTKKLKRKLREMEYKLKYQKKLAKEHNKRCKAETELQFTKMLLQNNGNPPESFYVLRKRR